MKADVVIVGAGIAGASLAAEIAGSASVLLLEAEAQPGYHSTGRSAAFWSESYGGPLVQPLTTASGAFLAHPPADFHDRSFLGSRGAVHIADEEGEKHLRAELSAFSGTSVAMEPLGRAELRRLIPGLRAGWNVGLGEPSCADINVSALHAAYLRAARARGARIITDSPMECARRTQSGWRVETKEASVEASIIVNAAGAWADDVALRAGETPLGIQPYRRTIAQLRVDPPAPADLPLLIDALGRFYFKPEAAGRIWLSPHDETACDPCGCAPEEYDVAWAIERLQRVVDWRVERVEHSWAGLRSFARDRLPVYGFSKGRPDFFWCAGQGGFGIQTAPAAAKMAASTPAWNRPGPDGRQYRSCALSGGALHELKGRIASELVCALILRMASMAFDPPPVDPVRPGCLKQFLPQLGILDRLLVRRSPAIFLPPENPLRDAVPHVDAVGAENNFAGAFQRFKRANSGEELHPVVGG